ncbi:MAG: hypothetical protein AAFR87_08155 [Bacteroidota bacterium]
MDITEHTAKKLVIEQRGLLLQGILASLFVAGISLTIGTARHFGAQSTYRFTYWMGGVLCLASLAGFTFLLRTSKAVFDKENDNFKLYHRKGWTKKIIVDKPLSEIKGLRIDQKGNPAKFRLSVKDEGEKWYTLQQKNTADLKKLEYLGKHIQAFLESTPA